MSCKDLFTDVDEVKENQREMIEVGSCLDPKFALVQNIDIYHEYVSSFKARMNKELESETIYMFYSFNIFDAEDPDRPIKTSIKRRHLARSSESRYDLILHNVELSDNIYSPFASSEKLSYLTMEETIVSDNDRGREVSFALSNKIVIEKRIRYNVWDLLGDVGGFNDGLLLVC